MFMVKEEYENVKNLFGVRIKTQAGVFKGLVAAAAILLAGSLGVAIIGILDNDGGFRHYLITDYSVTFFFGSSAAYIIFMLMYRRTNVKLSAFPQTNDSRFASSLLLNCILAVYTALISLAVYLLHLCVFKIISRFDGSVRFALNVDAGFIAAGFFVYLAYAMLVISAIELAGAILRKWTYYAVAAYVAALSLLIANIGRAVEYAPKLFAFILKEPSLPLFFLKAAGVCLVAAAAAFVINRHTVYYKGQNDTAKKGVLFLGFAVTAVIIFVVPALVIFNASPRSGSSVLVETTGAETGDYKDYLAGFEQIRVDVSHLPKGSNIRLAGKNIAIPSESGSVTYNDSEAVVNGADELKNLRGDTVVITLRPMTLTVNGIDISRFTNQRATASLDGDTLTVDYSLDNVKVVILPVWEIARQFDCFKGKNILPANIFGYSSGGNSGAQIIIYAE